MSEKSSTNEFSLAKDNQGPATVDISGNGQMNAHVGDKYYNIYTTGSGDQLGVPAAAAITLANRNHSVPRMKIDIRYDDCLGIIKNMAEEGGDQVKSIQMSPNAVSQHMTPNLTQTSTTGGVIADRGSQVTININHNYGQSSQEISRNESQEPPRGDNAVGLLTDDDKSITESRRKGSRISRILLGIGDMGYAEILLNLSDKLVNIIRPYLPHNQSVLPHDAFWKFQWETSILNFSSKRVLFVSAGPDKIGDFSMIWGGIEDICGRSIDFDEHSFEHPLRPISLTNTSGGQYDPFEISTPPSIQNDIVSACIEATGQLIDLIEPKLVFAIGDAAGTMLRDVSGDFYGIEIINPENSSEVKFNLSQSEDAIQKAMSGI